MEPIIAPVDKELIKAELTPDRFMRDTRKGGNISSIAIMLPML